jgi:hypothetical protein
VQLANEIALAEIPSLGSAILPLFGGRSEL